MSDVNHYASIVAVLLAGDVQARLVSNSEHHSVEVRGADGSRIYWGNDGACWAWTEVTSDGQTLGGETPLSPDAAPEKVAMLIAATTEDA